MATSMDIIGELNKFSIRHIETPFLRWKDSYIPPSPAAMDKRIAHYAEAYINGGDTAIPVIWDAIKNGGNANLVVAGDEKGKTEPLIVRAARNDKFFLVQALAAAGADFSRKDSDGRTALDHAQSDAVKSYLAEMTAAKTQAYSPAPSFKAQKAGFNTAADTATPAAAVISTAPGVAPQAKATI